MSCRIRHSLIVSYSIVGVCILSFYPLRASARLSGHARTSATQKSSGHAAKFQEQSVGKISGGSKFEDLQASNGHVAWVEQKASTSKWVVYRDGEQMGEKYDGVKYLEFSPDGEHLAFFGQRNSQWLLVLDGQERSQAFADVTPVVFAPRGSSWAFSACAAENTCTMVVGGHPAGTPRETYDQVSPPQFSLDGRRLGFMVQFHGKWMAIVDGKAIGPQVKGYSCLGFSPDAAHFFVCGTTNKAELTYPEWTYFVDGAPGPYFAQISPITFSSDDRHYAYGGSGSQVAFKKDKTDGTIVLDGKPGPEFQGRGLPGAWVTLLNAPIIAAEVYSERYSALGMSVLQFSKDEKHYWYTVSGASGKRGLVVVDGHESKLYSNLTGAQFDSADNGIIFFARRGKKLLRVTLPLN